MLRNANNDLIINTAVGTQISILQTTAGGTAVYVETHTETTNANGLVNLEIGSGTSADDFTTIDWANGPYFMETAVDVTGGTSYSVMGTSQLMSVPYALYAKTSGNGAGPIGPQGPAGNDGATGATGSQGSDGNDGAQGATGAQGDIGPSGADGAAGSTSPCGLVIGQTYQGGIIFYLDASGCHGLIAAPSDQSTGIQWNNGTFYNTTAFASCVGCGEGNTSMIVYSQGSGSYAAKLCYDLNSGGSTDWYLPSKYELNLMYANIGQGDALGLGNVGGFANDYYWSSTEYDVNAAWVQSFDFGNQFDNYEANTNNVRAVRTF